MQKNCFKNRNNKPHLGSALWNFSERTAQKLHLFWELGMHWRKSPQSSIIPSGSQPRKELRHRMSGGWGWKGIFLISFFSCFSDRCGDFCFNIIIFQLFSKQVRGILILKSQNSKKTCGKSIDHRINLPWPDVTNYATKTHASLTTGMIATDATY